MYRSKVYKRDEISEDFGDIAPLCYASLGFSNH